MVYAYSESEHDSFAVSPVTFDADIAIDPELSKNNRAIDDAMGYMRSRPTNQPVP